MTDLEQHLVWTAIRADAIDTFGGQTPRPEDEAPIIDAFESHPLLVRRGILEVGEALAAGKITWAWSALRARLERGQQALREATVDVGKGRARAVTAAEAWLENAGVHYDRPELVEAELFGDDFGSRGILGNYRDDHDLRRRMLDTWHDLRPRGEQAERDAEAWAATCRHGARAIAELRKQAEQQTLAELTDAHP